MEDKATLGVLERVREARRILEGVCECGAALAEDDTCDGCGPEAQLPEMFRGRFYHESYDLDALRDG